MSDKEPSSITTTWGQSMDAAAHQKTYKQFLYFLKWGTIVSAAILLILIVFVFG